MTNYNVEIIGDQNLLRQRPRLTVRKIASYNLYRYGLPRTCCIYTDYNLQIVICIDADSNLSMQIVVSIYTDCILCQCRLECHSRLHSVSMQIVYCKCRLYAASMQIVCCVRRLYAVSMQIVICVCRLLPAWI